MADRSVFTAGNGTLWVQPKGPGTALIYLGCHDVPSIDEPLGDYTPLFCPDPAKPKAFVEVGETFAPAAAVTMQVVEDVTGALSYLREQKCPMPIYLNVVECGRRDVFGNASLTLIVDARKITNRSTSNLAMRESDDRMERTYDIAGAPPVIEVRSISPVLQTIASTEQLEDIAFLSDEQCAGTCGAYEGACENGITVTEAAGAIKSTVWHTEDYGVTWVASAADPFAVDESILSIAMFKLNQTTTRWLVARETDAATVAEIGYSDNTGAAWTLVDVEAVGTRGAAYQNSLFVLDGYNIWLGLTDGYIVKSADQGLTWTTQTSGGVTAEDVMSIHFSDTNNGVAGCANGIVLVTDDGGSTWTAATPITAVPDVQAVWNESKDVIFAGCANGTLYKSFNKGVTWTLLFTGTDIKDLKFANRYVAFLVDSATVRRTRNGWTDSEITTPPGTPASVRALHVCDSNTAYVAGETAANAGYVVKISG